jgi:hypothetical protein
MSDEEIEQKIVELSGVTVAEVRGWTPEEQQRRDDETLAALSEDVLDLMRQAPSISPGLRPSMIRRVDVESEVLIQDGRRQNSYKSPASLLG